MNTNEQKAKRDLTRQTVRRLDDNICLIDYLNDYDTDGILEEGVSSIGGLLAFLAKRFSVKKSSLKPGNMKGAGCTTFDTFTPSGEHLLGRNFDFREAPCFVVWTHPENHYASVSVVDGNFMTYGSKRHVFNKDSTAPILMAPYCCVDGINEKGLSIAVLQIKAKATKQTDPSKKDITTTVMIRAVLDTCANIDEALELIKKYNMHDSLFCCYHYQLSDASGRSVIVEYIANKLHIYERNSDKYSTEGSVYEDDGLDYIYASNFSLTKDIGDFKIEQHGEDRVNAVKEKIAAKGNKLTEKEAMQLLRHVRLDYDHPKYPWRIVALWSAVYNCDEKSVTLCANTDYSKVYKFAVNKPGEVVEYDDLGMPEYPETQWEFI